MDNGLYGECYRQKRYDGQVYTIAKEDTYSMSQKKFPFLTVPFVAQWYYNGQSVPFRLYVPFRSVCSSALPVTLELDCRLRCRLVRENDVVKACLCLVNMTTGELQALSLVGFADELPISATAKRPAQLFAAVQYRGGTERNGMARRFQFRFRETERNDLSILYYRNETFLTHTVVYDLDKGTNLKFSVQSLWVNNMYNACTCLWKLESIYL